MNNSAIQNTKREQKPLLYRWDDLVLSFSNAANQLRPHYHGAAELVIGYQCDVLCKLGKGQPISAPSILIPPGITHQNEYQDNVNVTIYFDSDSSYFKRLSNEMVPEGGVYTSIADVHKCQEKVGWIYENEPGIDTCREKVQPCGCT